jgi:hypothetical protein
MPEATQIVFKHKELVEILVKAQGIHDGIWGLFIRFGIGASNVGASETDIQPAAIVPVTEIGLQKFDKETSISVDAAKVNPAKESGLVLPNNTATTH